MKRSASKKRAGWHDSSWGQGEVERESFASIYSLPFCFRQRANPITVLWINISTPGLSALQGHSTTQVKAGSQLKCLTQVLSETVLCAAKSQPMVFSSYLSRQCQSFQTFFTQTPLIYEELLLLIQAFTWVPQIFHISLQCWMLSNKWSLRFGYWNTLHKHHYCLQESPLDTAVF